MAADSALEYLHAPLAQWVRAVADPALGHAKTALEQQGFEVQDAAGVWPLSRECGALRTSRSLDIRDPQSRTRHQLRLDLVSARRTGGPHSPVVHELRLALEEESAVLSRAPRATSVCVAVLTRPTEDVGACQAVRDALAAALAGAETTLRNAVEP